MCRIKAINWTSDAVPSLVQHVSVDHSRADIVVGKQLLNRSNVISAFE